MPTKEPEDCGYGASENADGCATDRSVGYKRPPRHTQFKKGQSGNLKGRTKGAKNSASLLIRELDKPAVVIEGGRRKTVPKREVIVAQLVNKAASGDLRATGLVFQRLEPIEARAEIESRLEAQKKAVAQGFNEADRIMNIAKILHEAGAFEIAEREAGLGDHKGEAGPGDDA